MDIGKSLSYVFEDQDWIKKILLGALIMLIPIFGAFALLGYGIAIVRNVMAGSSRPLPEWNDMGAFFMDGLKFWVVGVIYVLPVIIVACPVSLVWLLPALGGENEDLMGLLAGVSGILFAGFACLVSLYSILVGLLSPMLQVRFANTGDIGACLKVGEIFKLTFANIGNIIISMVVMWIASSIIISVVGSVTFGLLALPASLYVTAAQSHLIGQIGRQADLSVA